jgi:hypothetical protein
MLLSLSEFCFYQGILHMELSRKLADIYLSVAVVV